MGGIEICWLAGSALVIAVMVVALLVYPRYRRDMRTAYDRLPGGGSQVVETGCGPIEYATVGGAPVLVVHGILGWFDQGLVIA